MPPFSANTAPIIATPAIASAETVQSQRLERGASARSAGVRCGCAG